MTSINKPANEVFQQLLKQLATRDYVKCRLGNNTAICFEYIGQQYSCYGPFKMYSLIQTTNQKDDLSLIPEMCFFYFDEANGSSIMGAYPYCFQLDLLGIYEKSILFTSTGELQINLSLQKQHSEYANSWLVNIGRQERTNLNSK